MTGEDACGFSGYPKVENARAYEQPVSARWLTDLRLTIPSTEIVGSEVIRNYHSVIIALHATLIRISIASRKKTVYRSFVVSLISA